MPNKRDLLPQRYLVVGQRHLENGLGQSLLVRGLGKNENLMLLTHGLA
ncbi:unnamed protein product [Prunus brigantina]